MNLELIKTLTTLNTNQIYKVLTKFLKIKGYTNIRRDERFILAEGELPICLIAHIDTVFRKPQEMENFIYDPEKRILWGIGGSGFDDRAGIYAIIELLQKGYRPHILFTDLEEHGGIGASELVNKYPKFPFESKCKALIELDRANEKDAVFYSCDNQDFSDYIESFDFEYDFGTFTDISVISPAWGIAAVNLSVGYRFEHTDSEILHVDWLDATIDKVERILLESENMKVYEYIPSPTRHYGRIYPRYEIKPDECLICGAKLDPKETISIYDEDFPYNVCAACYKQYYVVEDPVVPQEEPPFDF